MCCAPFLLDDPNVTTLFPVDAVERARKTVASFGVGGVGGYTDSRGNAIIRGEVADFIQRRDGHKPETEVCVVVLYMGIRQKGAEYTPLDTVCCYQVTHAEHCSTA